MLKAMTALGAVFIGFFALPLAADDPVVQQRLDEVLSELRDLRKLIEGQAGALHQPQPTRAEINVGDAPFLGSKEAPLTIVEFTDYQCPYCNRFFKQTFPGLKRVYIDTGRLRFYVMDDPLEAIHKNALIAAEAAHCAADQGQFWAFHDQMQGDPDHLSVDNLIASATEFGLSVRDFRECIESGKYLRAVEESARMAQAKGVRGTPAFVIGVSKPTGVEGDLVIGAVPIDAFQKLLDKLSK
jgi:protein-disulfide isomerase